MTRRQLHVIEVRHVPRTDDDAARPRIGFDLIDGALNLVNAFPPVLSGLFIQRELWPTSSLIPVNGPEFAFFVRPVVPNGSVLSEVIVDVGGPAQKPEQLPNYAIEQNLLGGEKRKSLSEVIFRLQP